MMPRAAVESIFDRSLTRIPELEVQCLCRRHHRNVALAFSVRNSLTPLLFCELQGR